MQTRVAALGEAKKAYFAVLTLLIDKSNDAKILMEITNVSSITINQTYFDVGCRDVGEHAQYCSHAERKGLLSQKVEL